MKNTLLLIGFVLLIINTACGLIFTGYDTFNMVFGDLSIVLSTILVYTSLQLNIADGFKIAYTVLFGISGLVRFYTAIISSQQFKDNFSFLLFITIFCVEIVLVFIAKALNNK